MPNCAPAVQVDGLRKTYGDKIAVDDISLLASHPGEIFGILGPNGAGKTTTVECDRAGCGSATPGGSGCSATTRGPTRPAHTRCSASSSRRASCSPRSPCARRSSCGRRSTTTRPPWSELAERLGLGEPPRPAVRQAQRRPAAATLHRARPGRPPARRDPRRAEHRARPAGPPRDLGARARAPRDAASPSCSSPTPWRRRSSCATGSPSSTPGACARTRHPGRPDPRRGRGHRDLVRARRARSTCTRCVSSSGVAAVARRGRPGHGGGPTRTRVAAPCSRALAAPGRHPPPPPGRRRQPRHRLPRPHQGAALSTIAPS